MKLQSIRTRLLASTMICGALVSVFAPQAFAADNSTDVGEVVVTGTRIRQPNLTAVSPMTAVSAVEIKQQGVTRVEDLVNSLPQVFAAQGASISNGASGTATVNLRGLGVSRTLVTIDGRRLGPGTAGSSAADLNFIPAALIKRVDVVTGGASAVYGSDAVAGVVNFVMNRDLDGVLVEATGGMYQHHNDSSLQAFSKARGFSLPPTNVNDGETRDFTIVVGSGTPDGNGHIEAYATYRSVEAILQGSRDYSNCTLNSGSTFSCGGSGTAYPARIGSNLVSGTGAGRILRPRVSTDVYNFGPANYYQRPDERYTMGAFARYKINDHFEVYSDLMFMNDSSVAQIAPGGIFAGTKTINCDNAYASAQQLTTMCGANAGSATANFTGVVARRNVEGGGRQNAFEFSDYRTVVGVRGAIAQGWEYDVSGTYYKTVNTTDTLNYFVSTNIDKALIAKKNASGQIVCQSVIDGTDLNCVPYNLFDANGVTAAQLNYLQAPGSSKGQQVQQLVTASVSGDLGQYGVKSPFASSGVGVAFGVETRMDSGKFAADYLQKQGLLSGSGGASPDVTGRNSVNEWFVEARGPLLSDMPYAKSLNLEAGYRSSDYAKSGKVEAYKFGGDWTPVADIRVRASYQQAVRAPNINELFSPSNVQLDGSTDPCAGTAVAGKVNGFTAAQCAFTGVSAAQFGNIEKNPAPQYNGLTGGNPNLKPETSKTTSFGFVVRPSFIPGFSASLDYFDIKVEDSVSTVGADLAINRCLASGQAYFCNLIKRDSTGSLWLSNQGYIIDTNLNTGSLGTKGYDVNLNYKTNLDDIGLKGYGSASLSLVGTYLDKLTTQPLPGDPSYDCTGYYGNVCGTPNPVWRHKARLTWDTPFLGITTSLQWRYFASVKVDASSSDPQLAGDFSATDAKISAQSYIDLSGSIDFAKNYTLRIGANNLLDKDPPINGANACPTGACNGNTWPQVYDAVGRFVYATITAKW